jgi:hypothetical protein
MSYSSHLIQGHRWSVNCWLNEPQVCEQAQPTSAKLLSFPTAISGSRAGPDRPAEPAGSRCCVSQALKLSKDFNLHTARVLQPCGDHRQLTGEITQLPASHMLQGLNPAVDCTAHTLRCFSMVGMGRLWPTSPRAAHHLFLYNSQAKNCYDRWTFFISLMTGNAIFEPKQAKCYPIRRIAFFSWMHLYYKVLDIRIISYYEFHE